MKVCSQPGCPVLTTATRCPTHTREKDRARGSRHERGYDAAHDALRAEWAPIVAMGNTKCARCKQIITIYDAWELDHTDDRTAYLGPSHEACNRGKRPIVDDAQDLHHGGGEGPLDAP